MPCAALFLASESLAIMSIGSVGVGDGRLLVVHAH